MLSGGEQQMVVLAQALVCEPRYMLIDELSLGLAPVIVNRLVPRIRAVAESGIGILLIEQFTTIALGLANQAHIMEGGQLRFSGLARDLRERPELLRSAYLLRGSACPASPARRQARPARQARQARLPRSARPTRPARGALMRAAVTEGVGCMTVLERPEPGPPGPGQVVIRPEAVGICGSDYHFFAGEMSDAAGGSRFPRVQGHEVAGEITALGPGCRAGLDVGQRVAVWPLHPCGQCYPCGAGRPNACDRLTLTGVHLDGGLQELLAIGQRQVFPIAVANPAVAAMAEPVSIAVRAVNRAAVRPGERAVVLGAGPIGQCIGLVARERGAETLLVDLEESLLALSREMGSQEAYLWRDADNVVAFAREWAGRPGRRSRSTPPAPRPRRRPWSTWSPRPGAPSRSACPTSWPRSGSAS